VNWRALWAQAVRWYAARSARDRRIWGGVGVLVALSLLYLGVVKPVIGYRQAVKREIAEGLDQLEHARRFLAAADGLRAERDDQRQKLAQAKQRLLPGSSGTLGAAALQERANSLAAEKGVTVQSTQVMKEEPADPFRKIAIRLTLSGELRPLAELLSGLEYGPQQLSIPFIEISRRGAIAGAKGPRTISATVEVNDYLEGEQAKKAEAEPGEGEGEPTASAPDAEALPVPSTATLPGGEVEPPVPAPEAVPPTTMPGATTTSPASTTTAPSPTAAAPEPLTPPPTAPAAPAPTAS